MLDRQLQVTGYLPGQPDRRAVFPRVGICAYRGRDSPDRPGIRWSVPDAEPLRKPLADLPGGQVVTSARIGLGQPVQQRDGVVPGQPGRRREMAGVHIKLRVRRPPDQQLRQRLGGRGPSRRGAVAGNRAERQRMDRDRFALKRRDAPLLEELAGVHQDLARMPIRPAALPGQRRGQESRGDRGGREHRGDREHRGGDLISVAEGIGDDGGWVRASASPVFGDRHQAPALPQGTARDPQQQRMAAEIPGERGRLRLLLGRITTRQQFERFVCGQPFQRQRYADVAAAAAGNHGTRLREPGRRVSKTRAVLRAYRCRAATDSARSDR